MLTSAVIVAAATVFTRFFGFFREITLAAVYGAGMISDAFVVAFTVPGFVLAVIGASTATVFIPVYTGIENGKSRFTGNVLTLLSLIGLIFSVVFTFVPQTLTFAFASQLDAETFALATELMRIMVWTAIPILLTGVLQSYLQIQKAFFIAAIIGIPVNIAAILSIAWSKSVDMMSVMGYGVVAGNAVMLVLLMVAVKRKGYAYRPTLNLKTPELRTLLIMLSPVMISTCIGELNLIIDRNFASSLASGSISSLNWSSKTVGLLTSLVGISIATVLFPRMSELAVQGNTIEIRKYITACFRKLIPALLPATVGIILLAKPIVRIMFERGDFSPEDTLRTAECLQMYAALLFAQSLSIIVVRALFALRDTKTPAVIMTVCVVVSIALNFMLIGPLAHMGLALSSSIVAMLGLFLALIALRKRLGPLQLKNDGKEWVKILIATIVMGVIVAIGVYYLPIMSGGILQCVMYTGALVFAGIGIYILMHVVMRTAFLRETLAILRNYRNTRG
jgi:putative peptidoglycan lipid II flippase